MLRLFQGPPDISLHRAPKKLDTALAIINVYFIFTHTFGGRVGAKNPLLGQTLEF